MDKTKLKSLEDFDFKDKNVFMRVDFNVPLREGKIADSYRIEKTMPGIRSVLEKGGRLILASHLGRPGGTRKTHLSLKPVAEHLSETYNLEIIFIEEPDSEAPRYLLPSLKSHQALLLENLRFHPGEETLNPAFAKRLASLADIYINEAFSISHREHTSLSLLPQEIALKGMGLQFEKEMEMLDTIKFNKAQEPFLVILGGNKLTDKIPLMESLIDQTDEFLLGGLMACAFLKAMGKPIGETSIPSGFLTKISLFMERLRERGKTLFLPVDHVMEKEGRIFSQTHIPLKAQIRDIGPKTLQIFQDRIRKAKSVFWNGPVGFFEKPAFQAGTKGLAQAIAQHKQAYRLVGGGHSAMAMRDFEKEVDHISTGGGASLAYLKGEILPGIKSLQD